ncbi:MAG: hypothetical protein OXC10_04535 [Rhodospirillaceae bacterium]|nr:hypothetical protein [Rhodospirillaceae bacterium]
MIAPDLAYVALVVDKPAASAAIFGKSSGLLRRASACGGSKIPVLFVGRSAPRLFRASDPNHRPGAGVGVCHIAGAGAGPDRKIRGGKS